VEVLFLFPFFSCFLVMTFWLCAVSQSTGTATTDMETTAESALEFSCAFSGTYNKVYSALIFLSLFIWMINF
jgi:hypothetical protein